MELPKRLRFAREYFVGTGLHWWRIWAGLFGVYGIFLSIVSTPEKYSPLPKNVTLALVIFVLLVAPFVPYAKLREEQEELAREVDAFKKSVIGGKLLLFPPSLVCRQALAHAERGGYYTRTVLLEGFASGSRLVVTFDWDIDGMMANAGTRAPGTIGYKAEPIFAERLSSNCWSVTAPPGAESIDLYARSTERVFLRSVVEEPRS